MKGIILFTEKAINILDIQSMIEKKIALLIETRPDAIGLNFFEGCCLSLSISIESLIK